MRKKNFKSSNKVITTEERNYRKEYDNYHSSPEQIKRRTKRNEARRSLQGRKDLTDDKDVHHKDGDPLNNDKSNLSIVTQRYNRREPRLRDKNAEETKVNENSGSGRLINRLKKKGLDLDKRAADRERQHRELVKKYAKEKQTTNEESSIDEASKIKIVKGDKTRMITKQELNTYKQMGWKVVNEEMNEATVEVQALDPKNASLVRSLKRNKVNMSVVERPKPSNGNAFIVKLTGDTKGIKSVLKTQWDGEHYDEIEENKKMKDDPCWKDYEMVGTKKKNGKEVPNCVPKKNETKETKEEVEPISFFKLRESLKKSL